MGKNCHDVKTFFLGNISHGAYFLRQLSPQEVMASDIISVFQVKLLLLSSFTPQEVVILVLKKIEYARIIAANCIHIGM